MTSHATLNYFATYARTLLYLKPWQILGRIVAKGKRFIRIPKPPIPPECLEGGLTPAVRFPHYSARNNAADLQQGRFTFLTETHELGLPINWLPDRCSLLWQFNLHYFGYLYLLDEREGLNLCRSWVTHNPPASGIGWHPYPTSLRVTNWCKAGIQDSVLLSSLYRQAGHLYRNVETYVFGNHVLENARALVLAGLFFDNLGEAPKWLARGLDLMLAESVNQILPDGGHYERSPMYQCLILAVFLDVVNCLPSGHSDRDRLETTARKMWDATVALSHPDGDVALFKDSSFEIALPLRVLRDYGNQVLDYSSSGKTSLPETGYFIADHSDLYLILDAGRVCPSHLLAHAHADIFSYELSICGKRFVVDAGVFEYQAGKMRNYVRSTRAHNTVCVDDLDQMECWSSFRVGRRYSAHQVSMKTNNSGSSFSGVFSGYERLIGDDISHHREVTIDTGSRVVSIDDHVSGRGSHRVESRIHLHPDVKWNLTESGVTLERANVSCVLDSKGVDCRIEDAWYCPCFGVKQKNYVIVLGGVNELPLSLSYEIRY